MTPTDSHNVPPLPSAGLRVNVRAPAGRAPSLAEIRALLAFKDANLANNTVLQNWTLPRGPGFQAAACRWPGVECDAVTGHVTVLRLNGSNIEGNTTVMQSIPSAFGDLTYLQLLDLTFNYLLGSIPSELGLCSQLSFISLSQNAFTGDAIPKAFLRLTQLRHLDMSNTEMGGSIPQGISRLQRLSLLSLLNLGQVEGPIPDELGALGRTLQYLDVSVPLVRPILRCMLPPQQKGWELRVPAPLV